MKKIIVLGITVGIVLLMIIGYNIYYYQNLYANSKKMNAQYESFYNIEVLGTDIASLINKIDDSNDKNNVKKNEKGLYIDNNKNSIHVEVKFLELDDVIPIERIENQGINQFVQNFGAMKFKCTKIEYHKNTGHIKYMYFEQIDN